MSTTDEVMFEAASLGAGDRLRTVCPSCRGGQGKERSLSISKDDSGQVQWNCFRNSCSFKGGNTERSTLYVQGKQSVTKPFAGDLRDCTVHELGYLSDTVGWYDEHIRIGMPSFAPESGRYAFPIFDPMGRKRGWVLRSYSEGSYIKALTRPDGVGPKCSWYNCGEDTDTIIVEDIPSAVRAAVYMNAVSLNGTDCSPETLLEISNNARNVLWALDADATAQAVEMQQGSKLLFDTSRVKILPCDLKNMDEDQLKETICG